LTDSTRSPLRVENVAASLIAAWDDCEPNDYPTDEEGLHALVAITEEWVEALRVALAVAGPVSPGEDTP
jgi:hypothetical protein